MKSGVELIAEERLRQIKVEGWTPEHDDEHSDGQLAAAASVYADFANYHGEFNLMYGEGTAKVLIPRDFKWPFEKHWLKLSPDNRVRELQKAGALIAAEIDRLNRLTGETSSPEVYLFGAIKHSEVRHFVEFYKACNGLTSEEVADIPEMLKQREELAERVVVMGKHLNDAIKLRSLTRQVRDAQKQYFKTRELQDLIQSKHLEKQLDDLLSTMPEDV